MSSVFHCSECLFENHVSAKRCKRCHYPLDGSWPSLVEKQIGNYKLVRRIGGGGFGAVYEARHNQLGHPVAAKVMHPQFSGDSSWTERFQQEAYLMAELRHQNVVQLLDYGYKEEVGHYLIMEWLEGQSLSHVCRVHPRPEWGWLYTLFSQLFDALEYAHERGIVHRDLKPDNLLITSGSRGHLVLKIVDFGIATLAQPGQIHSPTSQSSRPSRQSQFVIGTSSYMAPEQVKGHIDRMGPHTDLYACGLILSELLTGRRVFQGRNPVETMRLQVEARPPQLNALDPMGFFPDSLELVVQKALSKRIEARYQTASEFFDDLKSAFESSCVKPIFKDLYSSNPNSTSDLTLYRAPTREMPEFVGASEAGEKPKKQTASSQKATPQHSTKESPQRLSNPWKVMLIVLFTMGCAVFFAFGFYHRENLVDKKPSVAKIRRSLGQSKVAFETSRTKKTHPNKTKPKSTEPSQRPKSQVQKSQERNQKLKPQEDDAFGQPKLTRSPTPRTSTQQDSPPRSKSPGTNLTRRKRRVAPPRKPNARPRPARSKPVRSNPVRSNPVRTVVGYQIRTTPTNCQVWIDGKNQGNTPFRLKVLKGNTVTIVIKRKGFVTKKLTLRGDKSAQIKIQMIEDLF